MRSDQDHARPLQDRDLHTLRKPSKGYSVNLNPEMMLLRSENLLVIAIYTIK